MGRSRSRSRSPRRNDRDVRDSRGHGDRDREPATRTSLLIRNVPQGINVDDVKHYAAKHGTVRDIYMPKDYYSGEARGICFVEFGSSKDADEAKFHMDRMMIKGKEAMVHTRQEGHPAARPTTQARQINPWLNMSPYPAVRTRDPVHHIAYHIQVVFAQQGRKKPEDFRGGSRGGYGGGGGGGGSRAGGGGSRDMDRGGGGGGGRDRDSGSRRRSRSRSPSRSRGRRRSPSASRSPRRRNDRPCAPVKAPPPLHSNHALQAHAGSESRVGAATRVSRAPPDLRKPCVVRRPAADPHSGSTAGVTCAAKASSIALPRGSCGGGEPMARPSLSSGVSRSRSRTPPVKEEASAPRESVRERSRSRSPAQEQQQQRAASRSPPPRSRSPSPQQ
ncbi:MAG: hypothetical protein WDW38_005089 [Sanguina aurantia]